MTEAQIRLPGWNLNRQNKKQGIEMKRVLVTNDDGINASGLLKLIEALDKHCEVYAVAPAEQQSAKSMAITFLREVSVYRTEVEGATEAYVIDGTPVDCVRWAVEWFEERGITFDYLFSGINLGANVGIAAYYSGTIGAAREGALFGIRSIALSVGTHLSTHFEYICSLVPKLMEIADTLSPQTILSVNAPDLPPWEVRGLRIAGVAPYGYAEKYSFAPAGENYGKPAEEITWESTVNYQLGQVTLDDKGTAGQSSLIGPGMTSLKGGMLTDEDLKYDLDCMRYGFAAITPLSSGVGDDVALRKLQGRFSSDEVLAVFVDPQEQIASGIGMRNRYTGNMSRFAACIRRLDIPAAVTELYGYGRLIPEVAEKLGEERTERILRRELSAWGSADFAGIINSSSARKVLIAGLETHAAVLQTAIDFRRKGYDVSIIEDCCASREGHDHKIAIERLRDEGCRITTSRAAIMELVSAVNHPAAESIARLLK